MTRDTKSFLAIATPEQKELLINLSSAAEEETKYANEINKINGSVNRGGIYSSDGVCATICEDADDALVISMGPRKKLEEVRNKLKAYMERAVELGMGDVGIVERNYEHYVGKPLSKSKSN